MQVAKQQGVRIFTDHGRRLAVTDWGHGITEPGPSLPDLSTKFAALRDQ